jgi:hypothetical protein
MAVPWSELESQSPEIAELGRAALYQYGPGLGFLATVRADGGPRMHPVCPAVRAEAPLATRVHDLARARLTRQSSTR